MYNTHYGPGHFWTMCEHELILSSEPSPTGGTIFALIYQRRKLRPGRLSDLAKGSGGRGAGGEVEANPSLRDRSAPRTNITSCLPAMCPVRTPRRADGKVTWDHSQLPAIPH